MLPFWNIKLLYNKYTLYFIDVYFHLHPKYWTGTISWKPNRFSIVNYMKQLSVKQTKAYFKKNCGIKNKYIYIYIGSYLKQS